jgi:crotonobetainyl-CoA:carnitine CoA-transferase CaiB-like acyl-CoA transferase
MAPDQQTDNQPLSGIKVVEMATLAMGPLAGQTLGDYGAEVIKVESLAGDHFRFNGPSVSPDMGHTFLHLNRNKKSVSCDLKAAKGRELILRLVKDADIFISNTRPDAMVRLGLDYDSLRKANPDLIYCAAYGFSEDGPYAGRPAADDTIQAMAGVVDLQERATGTASFVASILADKAIGLTVVNAVLAALVKRLRAGGGEAIEVPMFETMVAFLMPEHMAGQSFEPPRGKTGYARVINPNRRPFRTQDGLMCILPYTGDQWLRFFEAIGRAELGENPEYATPAGRSRNYDALYAIIEEAALTKTNAQWTDLLLEQDILFGEVNSVDQLFNDPHLQAREMFKLHAHPTEGDLRMIGFPINTLSNTTRLRLLAPRLGEHSVEVALGLGFSQAEVDTMLAEGVLKATDPQG